MDISDKSIGDADAPGLGRTSVVGYGCGSNNSLLGNQHLSIKEERNKMRKKQIVSRDATLRREDVRLRSQNIIEAFLPDCDWKQDFIRLSDDRPLKGPARRGSALGSMRSRGCWCCELCAI